MNNRDNTPAAPNINNNLKFNASWNISEENCFLKSGLSCEAELGIQKNDPYSEKTNIRDPSITTNEKLEKTSTPNILATKNGIPIFDSDFRNREENE